MASIRSKFEAALWHMAGVDHPGGFIGKKKRGRIAWPGDVWWPCLCSSLHLLTVLVLDHHLLAFEFVQHEGGGFGTHLFFVLFFFPVVGLPGFTLVFVVFSRGGFTRFYPCICWLGEFHIQSSFLFNVSFRGQGNSYGKEPGVDCGCGLSCRSPLFGGVPFNQHKDSLGVSLSRSW